MSPKPVFDGGYVKLFENEGWMYASRRVDGSSPQNSPQAAYMIGIDENYRLLLIKQYRKSIGRWIWEFPAGLIEPGHTIEQTAIKEFKEETGLKFVPMFSRQNAYSSIGITNEQVVGVLGDIEDTSHIKTGVLFKSEFTEPDEQIECYLFDTVGFRKVCMDQSVDIDSKVSSFILGFGSGFVWPKDKLGE